MNPGDFEGDEQVLGRLREAAGGDAAVRQLRRRYDALRQDYEQLLDRLADIEDQLAPPAQSPVRPSQLESSVEPPPDMADALAAPLTRLRAEYLAAATRIQSIVTGLEHIAAGSLKGQHAPTAPEPSPPAQPEPEPAPAPTRPRRIQVDVKGHGFGELLDFQERLSSVDGVARVT
ncbi:MAG: hypothetical protein ACRDG3_04825, partial [Tepidiformaceae bacterium]